MQTMTGPLRHFTATRTAGVTYTLEGLAQSKIAGMQEKLHFGVDLNG